MSRGRRGPRKHPYNPTPWVKQSLDQIFANMAKKYKLPPLLLKAVAQVESALDPKAYRFEPGFWDRYLKNDPEWRGKDPKVVSASFGLMQLMFTTAWSMGFRGKETDLYDPMINVNPGAKLLRANINSIEEKKLHIKHQMWSIRISLSRYNGGSRGNPDGDSNLRNQSYVDKVFKAWRKLEGLS